MDFKKHIREVPDFPKKGILFYDITTLLAEADVYRAMINDMKSAFADQKIDKIAGIESRGFIFGISLSQEFGLPFIPVRKPGKLPAETYSYEYELEYGKDTLEVHKDAISANDNILLVDDLLATGGTIEASTKLVEKCGGKVAGCCFAIELDFLKARTRLEPNYKVYSSVRYDS